MWHGGHHAIDVINLSQRVMFMQEVDAYPAVRSEAQCQASVAAPLAPGPSPAALAPGSSPASVIPSQAPAAAPAASLGLQPGVAPLVVALPAPGSGGSGGSTPAGSASSTPALAPAPSSQAAAVSAATGWAFLPLMAAALHALL